MIERRTENNPVMPPQTALYQALEKRFMFDGAAFDTAHQAVDLSNGADAHEQQEVLSAIRANDHVIATQSLLEAISSPYEVPQDYSNIHEVIFIDSRVQDPQTLLAGISRTAAVEIIDNHTDGVAEIAQLLQKYHNLDAIHIISHGEEGTVLLGNATLNAQSLSTYSAELSNWGNALTSTGDILFYGCNVAEGEQGAAFVSGLRTATSADIGASTDETGAASLGGDWLLESSDQVDVQHILDVPDYGHLLILNASDFDNLTYYVGSGTVHIDSDIQITGISSQHINTVILTVRSSNSADNTGDTLGISSDLNTTELNHISVSSGHVYLGDGSSANDIGTYTVDNPTSQITRIRINFSNSLCDSNAAISALVQHITFTNSDSNMPQQDRNVNLLIDDGAGGLVHDGVTMSISDNYPPTLTATPYNPSFTENDSSFVTLFHSTAADTVEVSQDFTGMNMTFTVSNATGADIISVDGTSITLSTSGTSPVTTLNGYSISVNAYSSGETATVTVTHSGSLSESALQNMINGMGYKSTSDDFISATRTVTITSLTDSGGSQTDSLNVSSSVTITPINDAPTLTASAYSPSFTENDSSFVTIFHSTAADTVEVSQDFTGMNMTFTVSNATGADLISIDGTPITLSTSGTSPVTTSNGFSVSVASYTPGETATVTVTHSGSLSESALQNMVNGMGYKSTANDFIYPTRTVTITSLTDSGGSQTNSLDVYSSVVISAVDDAPTLTATGLNPTFAEGSNTAVTLFSSASASVTESVQQISSLTFTITNVNAQDIIGIDGSTTNMLDGNSISSTANNSLSVSVSIGGSTGSTATLTVTGSISPSNFQTLVNNITYRNTASGYVEQTRIFTLTEVTDTGSSMSPSVNTTSLNIISTVTLTPSLPFLEIQSTPTSSGSSRSSSESSQDFSLSSVPLLSTASPTLSTTTMSTITSNLTDLGTLSTATQLSIKANAEGSVATAIENMVNESGAAASKMADNLYEVAVFSTQHTGKTDLLKEVVSTIATKLDTQDPNYTVFLDKFVHDSRLSDAQKLEVVRQLIANGHEDIAALIMQKLDSAATLNLVIKQSTDASNTSAHCTPIS